MKQVGRELGVRYVLEGSVRKAGNRIRIAGQLIDVETGAHLWADRFDGALEDMFDLQDHVTSSVVGAIEPKLQQAEIKRARRKPTENLDAYDYYLRGLAKVRPWTKDANREALQLFCNAIERDPGLACAYGMAAWCYAQRKSRGWMIEHVQESAEGTRLARKAVYLGGDDPVALCMGGYALAFITQEFDDATAFMDRGLAVNPNLAQAWMLSAWLRIWKGEPDLALEHVARAMRLSRSIRPRQACKEPRHMLIFSRAAMIWRRHGRKSRCATIRVSCWQFACSQPAMRSRGGLSQHS